MVAVENSAQLSCGSDAASSAVRVQPAALISNASNAACREKNFIVKP
jgi:hypothetical protein